MNMYIWGIGAVNQLFLRGSYTQLVFKKTEELSDRVHSL